MLRVLVLIRLPLLLLFVILAGSFVGDLAADVFLALPYPHGVAKYGLECWQAMLYRARELPWIALCAAGAAGALSGLAGRSWILGGLAIGAAAIFFAPWHAPLGLAAGLALLGLAAAPRTSLLRYGRTCRALAWIPGTEILTPSVLSVGLGLGPRAHRALAAAGAAGLSLLWAFGDCLLSYDVYRPLMEVWPDSLVDPRVSVLDRVPAGVRAEWHGLDVVGDTAIVMAETTTRLIAYPLNGGDKVVYDLGERWDEVSAAPLDSETDPDTGLTWVIDGPDRIRELRWTGWSWEDLGSRRFPMHLQYVYTRWDRARSRVIFATVQANDTGPKQLAVVDVPGLKGARVREMRTKEGPVPVPREIEWIPPINRLVLAPDFGHRLYLVDVDTGAAEPWIEVPTLDGKMRWIPELGRLLLAIPNRPEIWLIDPATGAVDRSIPTQPGVRTAAIDVERGLLVTASVLTGTVLVQDLESGAVRDWFRTVMPMAREMELDTARGEAVLTTWSVLYRIPYAGSAP